MEERDQALIESYLANELSAEEKRQVEQRIKDDAAFRDMLNAYTIAVEGLRQNERVRLKERLKARDKILDRQIEQPARRVVIRWSIAAAAVVLLGLIGWKFLLPGQANGTALNPEQLNKLYAENYSPFVHDMSDPSVRGDSMTALDQFNSNYWAGHYEEAIARFLELDTVLQKNNALQFRYANALLAGNHYDEAYQYFLGVTNHGPSIQSTEAIWYLALIDIHRGNIPMARQHLKAYEVSTNPLLARQANNLLQQLED